MREDQQLEIFIRKHYSSMCAVALRFIGSPDIAQDITQEVIIKFWKTGQTMKTLNPRITSYIP